MDYSKYKYDQGKKERKIKKSQHVIHLKQIRLKPHIAESDYQTKLRHAIGFLEKKDKVRVNMFFRGREVVHKELGREVLDRMIKDLADYGQPEKEPSMEGKVMFVVFRPISGKKQEKNKD